MKMSQQISALIIILSEAKDDADKAESGKWGSVQAGVRARKKLKIVAREIKLLREAIIIVRKADKAKKKQISQFFPKPPKNNTV